MNPNTTINMVAAQVPRDDDTYLHEDGLLYCRRCGTPRQTRIHIFGREKVVPIVCQCQHEKIQAEEEELQKIKRQIEIERMRDAAFPIRRMKHWNFDIDEERHPEVSRAMREYVKNFDHFRKTGGGILLCGPQGTGKSFMAACVVNALVDRGLPCIMTSVTRIETTISGMWEGKQEYIDSLTQYALVAIDDLGAERDTEYMNQQTQNVLDTLYTAGVPMIITSNYEPKQMTGEDVGLSKARGFDRILERCHPIKVDGPSIRIEKGREAYKETKKILGI